MNRCDRKFIDCRPDFHNLKIIDYPGCYSDHEHAASYNELLYVLNGKVTLHMHPELKFRAVPGDFLLVPAGVMHRDEFAVDKGLRILMLQFNWNVDEYFEFVDNRVLANLSYAVRAEARRRLEFTLEQWSNAPGDENDRLNAALQLHGILLLFYRDLALKGAAPASPRRNTAGALNQVKRFMENNYAAPINLKQAAEKIGVSPSHLSRMFRRECGVGFNQHLLGLRLDAAKQLLIESRLQIAEIAARCGFGSCSYFIKQFRSHFGTTPKNYH
jgi:AraC-like DNA-binding protein